MCKLPRQLWTKLESGRSFFRPARDRFLVRNGVEGRIALDGSKSLTVQPQKISGTAMRREKISHPALEGPHGATEKERALSSIWHASRRGKQKFDQTKNRSYLPDPEKEHPSDEVNFGLGDVCLDFSFEAGDLLLQIRFDRGDLLFEIGSKFSEIGLCREFSTSLAHQRFKVFNELPCVSFTEVRLKRIVDADRGDGSHVRTITGKRRKRQGS